MPKKENSLQKTASDALKRRWQGHWKRVIGLTGGLGSGKSTVLSMFGRKGAFTFDADGVVRLLLEKDQIVLAQIRRIFGSRVFYPNGRIDKMELARRIFSSERDRRKLEGVLHPLVREALATFLESRKGGSAVCDIPLLFESGWDEIFDRVVVVDAPSDVRAARLMKRGMSPRDIKRRLKAQWPLERKTEKADFVINNAHAINNTYEQFQKLWSRITHEGD